jgi:hypothetical protein
MRPHARSPTRSGTPGERADRAVDASSGDERHHGRMTDAPGSSTQLPPRPDLYDSPRAERARAKGLDAPYIAGGEDPDPGPALEVDRKYGRLLLVMVITIVLAGFIIGIAVALAQASL